MMASFRKQTQDVKLNKSNTALTKNQIDRVGMQQSILHISNVH